MKHLRRILTSIVAIVMTFAIGATAYAVGNSHTISLTEGDTHTYNVYQVLTGTLAKEGEDELGNPAWGENATNTERYKSVNEFIEAINNKNLSEQDIAELVANVVDTTGDPYKTVSKDEDAEGLETGYYVMVDTTQLTGDHKQDTKALHVVKVVNDIQGLAIKWGTTQDDKKIVSDTLGKDGLNNIEGDGKTDNVSIGDTVNYQITASIPANAGKYNYFYFVINDTLDKGLTLNNDFVVKVGNTTLQPSTDYILKTGTDAGNYSFQIGLKNAKAYPDQDVIVTYSAVLNENATLGESPNKNTSTVTYSNDPNHDYDGEHFPAFPADKEIDAIGVTPVTQTETFTTGIQITKEDGKGNILTGASFTLKGDSVEKVLTEAEIFEEATDGEYYKLKDGTYTTTAPVTEDTMVAAEAGATEGYVVDETYDGDDKVNVGGLIYRPYAPSNDTDAEVFVLQHANSDQYEDINKTYKKTNKTTLVDNITNHEIQLPVNSNGIVKFDGLGEGTYTISETKTPAGYNTISDLEVEIAFDEAKKTWTATSDDASFSFDAKTGVFKVTIQNNKGTSLPSTGGIGTTIFYIVGGVMVAGAVVFLLTKRRMSGNE